MKRSQSFSPTSIFMISFSHFIVHYTNCTAIIEKLNIRNIVCVNDIFNNVSNWLGKILPFGARIATGESLFKTRFTVPSCFAMLISSLIARSSGTKMGQSLTFFCSRYYYLSVVFTSSSYVSKLWGIHIDFYWSLGVQ